MDDRRRTQLARAATVVMMAFVLSRVLGLGREMVIGNQFGTSRELDAYLAAFRIPDIIFQLVAGGALGSAFIPTFTSYLAHRRVAEAWRLASSIINLVLVILTTSAILAAVLAPWLVRTVVVPGFSPEEQALTVRLMRIMLLSPIVFGLSGVVMGILNSYQRFLLPAIAPAVYNLCIIAGAVFLGPHVGVYGLAIGVVTGAVLHLGIQIPQLVRQGLAYKPLIDLTDDGVREVGRLMLPRILGLATVQVNFLVNTLLASGLAEGSLSALNYAWLLMMLPQGIFAMGIATAAFPTFSDLAATGRKRELRSAMAETLRLILFLAIPSTVILFVLGEPLIKLLLERGRFDPSSTRAVLWALQFYALGLIAHSLLEIVNRGFYSLHDTRTPVAAGAGAMGLSILLSLLLIGPLRHGGLALANSIASVVETVILLLILRGRLGGLEGSALLSSTVKTVFAAGVMGVGLILFGRWTQSSHLLLQGGGAALLAMLLFLGTAIMLRCDEVRAVGLIFRR